MNKYYSYNTSQMYAGVQSPTAISLILVGDEEENEIIIEIYMEKPALPGAHNSVTSRIMLTEQEQNDLIAGILERRGTDLVRLQEYLKEEKFWSDNGATTSISPVGNRKSKVHPSKD